MASPSQKAPAPSPWRTYEQEPEQKSSGFFGGALGAIAIAIGVGAIGAYALDYHRHHCDRCGSRWGHLGAFNLNDEESHTCARCGQVQWWKCGAPHVMYGSQFVAPSATPVAPGHMPVPATDFSYVPPPPMYAYVPPHPVPPPVYAPPYAAPPPAYAPPAPSYGAPSYQAPAPSYPAPAPTYAAHAAQPTRTFLAGAPQQLSARVQPPDYAATGYAPAPEYARTPREYAHSPEHVRSPRYAPSPEYARAPARALAAARTPSYAHASEYGQAPEPSTAVAIRPKERWR